MKETMGDLIKLAEQVGGEAWPFLVEHTLVDALVGIWICGIAAVACGIIAAIMFGISTNDSRYDGGETAMFIGVVFLVALLCCCIGLTVNIPAYLAPEGATLKDLLP